MKKIFLPSVSTLFLLAASANAAITYLDATITNTFLADGTALQQTSTLPSPNVDDYLVWANNTSTGSNTHWKKRSYGNNGSAFSSGDGTTYGDAPALYTLISGLAANQQYEIYIYFWNASGNTWKIQAGGSESNLTTYGTSNSTALSAYGASGSTDTVFDTSESHFSNASVLTGESNRSMFEASLGVLTANASGQIKVYIDDTSPTSNSNRTWYDGVGYAAIPEPSTYALAGGGLALGIALAVRRRRN